ncbi:UBA and UBX domain-containing protein [Platanthera zijinensis]|uniref:UBA and UBX domain-containing protein n=1 Tax=Platanthera zijinensis TaxID=2320716 RepID=A0AAP0AUK5_9ASPA
MSFPSLLPARGPRSPAWRSSPGGRHAWRSDSLALESRQWGLGDRFWPAESASCSDDLPGGKEEGLLESFCGITSSSREEALFFLESHNWLLDSALHSYFENSAGGEGAHFPEDPPQPQTLANQSGFLATTTEESPASLLVARSPVSMSNSRDKKTASRPSGSGPAIRTLADLNRRPSDSGSGSDSDEPEEYYTGGEKRWDYHFFPFKCIDLLF